MWFQRVISWFRALFSALDDVSDAPYADDARPEPPAPMIEPEFTRRQLLYPRDPLKSLGLGSTSSAYPLEPPLYESPKTIPLIRLSPQVDLRFDEPSQPLPVSSEPPTPYTSREPTQPAASEPLSASLQRLTDLPDSLDSFDQMDDLDDMTRRLLFLRRLVRQRVYNEGFSLHETPTQYRRSLGLADQTDVTDSQN
ncbi:MAG TPA: hypothetical protein VE338_03440 [Ktedonobacterales bacterium]|jgi:hypothetical protein|nr:hypothetical protein [Ktedonobacterales bacterium]